MMEKKEYELLVGTYTGGASKGIYSYAFDPRNGGLRREGVVGIENPSYLTVAPQEDWVYAVTENPESPAYASALKRGERPGMLSVINRRVTEGAGPCFIALDPSSRFILTANYADGSLSVFPREKDGSLGPLSRFIVFSGQGPVPGRQEASHPHCIRFSPDGRYVFVSDLGADRLYRFGLDYRSPGLIDEASRVDVKTDAGDGPRHFIFSPSGRFLYLVNELSGTVAAYTYREGELSLLQKSTLGPVKGGDGGDIVMAPSGKFLYASLREGNDGIGVFRIDPDSGQLTEIQYVRTALHPRGLTVSPDGKFLLCAAMKGNVIEAYPLSPSTGKLGDSVGKAEADQPVCLVFAGIPEEK